MGRWVDDGKMVMMVSDVVIGTWAGEHKGKEKRKKRKEIAPIHPLSPFGFFFENRKMRGRTARF